VGVLALHGGYPVLPVSVEGTAEIWPKGKMLPRLFSAQVRVKVGEPTVFERPTRPRDVAAQVRGDILDLRGNSSEEPGRDGAGAQEITGDGSST
jgi:1-acyl-sn-glycerol-3-phosphate acyltransferase